MTWLAELTMLSYGWRRFLLLLAAGALAGFAAPPFFILPLLFVSVPVWVWALDGAERRPGLLGRIFGPAFSIGFALGLGYFLVAIHWIGAAFFIDGGVMLALMPFAVLALAAGLALFWGLGSALAHAIWSDSPLRIFALAGALTLAEFARGHVLTGFPFDLLGYALTANDEMLQAASLLGVYGLTFFAFLIPATPAIMFPADGRRLTARLLPLFLGLGLIAAQLGFGVWRLGSVPVEINEDVRLRLVQPAIPQDLKWALDNRADTVERLLMLSESRLDPSDQGLADITHLVWPESAIPFFLSEEPQALARIGRMLPDTTMLLTGAPRDEYFADGTVDPTAPGYNSVLAIDTNGEVVASYDKTHLVPVGEYLPFQDVFRAMGIGQFVPGAAGWTPGEARRLMQFSDGLSIFPLVCYEILFSGELGSLVAQADFILNVTNDAWFDGSVGKAQHFHHARLRAVEEGVPLVRVANTGVTAVIDPLGRVTARLAEDQMAVLDVSPPRPIDGTIFAVMRHWSVLILALLGLGLGLWGRNRPLPRR